MLDALIQRREKWVEANRENGFEDGILKLLTDLYPDNAHFIYELLQNAEDTDATRVQFALAAESVTFAHNGQRLFNVKDVKSITSIGDSTKKDDGTSIGKFGVGFKAVFAYTDTPEIHSGDFHFKIHDLVVPEKIPEQKRDGWTTFRFPFDNAKKSPQQAVEEIRHGLQQLADNTLLFLNNIRSIEYTLPRESTAFTLIRADQDGERQGQRIEIQTPGATTRWLRYHKEVHVKDEDGKVKVCTVAVAFKLEKRRDAETAENKTSNRGRKTDPEWQIVPCEPGQVSIFFPAEKETSNLRFHLHAPFASTVARDSVRDCDANKKLRDALAALIADALEDIRDRKLLDVSFLGVLPNQDDNLSPLYEPIRDAIVTAFQERDLLPTKSGKHGRAGGLYRGPSDISSLINDDDLSLLTGYDVPLWAANAPQRGQREDKFIESLAVDEWGWEQLAEVFPYSIGESDQKKIETWLAKKADAWLLRFYALMGKCCEETSPWSKPTWRTLAAIRVTNVKGKDKHVTPSKAFFPQQGNAKEKTKKPPQGVLLVKPEVYAKGKSSENIKKATREFLLSVGVKEYDELAAIKRRLERYEGLAGKAATLDEAYFRDIRAFIAFRKQNPQANASLFSDHAILVSEDKHGCTIWSNPDDLVLDAPYEKTGLGELTAIHGKAPVWPQLLERLGKTVKLEDFVAFCKSVGVMSGLIIHECNALEWGNDNKAMTKEVERLGPRWVRKSRHAIDQDWTIDALNQYLSAQSVDASRLVWLAAISAPAKAAKARWSPNAQYRTVEVESRLVQALKSCAWIPDREGTFHTPQDISQDKLPKDFPYDDRNGLLTAIGFGENVKKATESYRQRSAFAKEMGCASVEELEEALKLLKAKKEGRIREIAAVEAKTESGDTNESGNKFPHSTKTIAHSRNMIVPQTSKSAAGGASEQAGLQICGTTHTAEPRLGRVLRDIGERVAKVRAKPAADEAVRAPSAETDDDDDIQMPRFVDYDQKIKRAEERIAGEVSTLEHAKELTETASAAKKYSFAWFKALLKLEGIPNGDQEDGGRQISIGFGRVSLETGTVRTLRLEHPSRYIPPAIEELTGFRLDLDVKGTKRSVTVESVSVKGYTLRAKLKSPDEIAGVNLADVAEARIDVQSPAFLLRALQERFARLPFKDTDNLRDQLPPNIAFVFGPPGTGKTTNLAKNVLMPAMRGEQDKRVLVLVPTNKAADVLVSRIMKEMGDIDDSSFEDWLVRFGTTNDEAIENAGLTYDRTDRLGDFPRCVVVTTIARFTYDTFATNGESMPLDEADWDMIVIDEASMIPLADIVYPLYKQHPDIFIIAGDPFQIEPITAVDLWKDENIYTLVGLKSFSKPQTVPHPFSVTALTTQYRSVPAIGEVFSRFAYDGILKHQRSADDRRALAVDGMDIQPLNVITFPVRPYESIYRAKRLQNKTPYQPYSALFTFEFVKFLAGQIQKHHTGESCRIGIIAPYRAQADLIDKLTASWRARPANVEIQVGTIHGFQGDECDIILAVFNPPPSISQSPNMFLNKINILNVAVSRARDYLFVLMPDDDTENIWSLKRVQQIKGLMTASDAYHTIHAHEIEKLIFGNERHLEENAFATSHQLVNVYGRAEKRCEIRSDDTAVDIQIHADG